MKPMSKKKQTKQQQIQLNLSQTSGWVSLSRKLLVAEIVRLKTKIHDLSQMKVSVYRRQLVSAIYIVSGMHTHAYTHAHSMWALANEIGHTADLH